MTSLSTIWNHSMEAMNAFVPYYRQSAEENMARTTARHTWLPLLKSAVGTQARLAGARFTASTPYMADQRRREMLQLARENGFLADDASGYYSLTERGRSALEAFFNCAQAAIASAPVLPDSEMEELANLLQRIVSAAERAPLPQTKFNLESSRWTDPGPLAPAAVRVEQYLTDLSHFREDAHNASWQIYGLDGRAWEAFTYIWRGKAHTPQELALELSERGYDEAQYEGAIHLLLGKGWIEQVVGRWQVSDAGRAIRSVAEMYTDRLFFAPWQGLNPRELERLNELLLCLSRTLVKASVIVEDAAISELAAV